MDGAMNEQEEKIETLAKSALGNKDLNEFSAAMNLAIQEQGSSVKKWWLMAASVAIIAAVGATFLLQPPTGAELYADNYKRYDAIGVTRSVDNETDPLKKGAILYQQGKTEEAISTLEGCSGNDVCHLYMALAYMEIGETEIAEVQMNSLLESVLVGEQSRWFLALLLLNQERMNEAKAMLQPLQDSKTEFGDGARSILEYL